MRKRKLFLWIFLALTILNILVFFSRDRFRYQSYTDYSSLYAPCDRKCYDTWSGLAKDVPTDELLIAKKISDSFLIEHAGTYSRVLRIGNFLYNRFHNQLGSPGAALQGATPLQQFRLLSANDSLELWCNNFAQMFSMFCWSQDIVCRTIEVLNPGDHHVLNECYLPETKKWMVVDLTSNLLSISIRGQLANFIDSRKAAKDGVNMEAMISAGDSINSKKVEWTQGNIPVYYKDDLPLYFYHTVNLEKVYGWQNKIRSYLTPVSWYDIFREKGGNNLPFYLKQVLIVLWIASFFVFLGSRTKFRS